MKPFLKVGKHLFAIAHITHVTVEDNLLCVNTSDYADGCYSIRLTTPEGKAFLSWLSSQWEDVMAPEGDVLQTFQAIRAHPEQPTPRSPKPKILDCGGIRIEVSDD